MSRQIELALKKQRLQIRSAELRGRIGEDLHTILHPLATAADGAQRAFGWLRGHPQWLVGGLTALLVLRPRRVWRWSWRIFGALRLLRNWQPAAFAWWLGRR